MAKSFPALINANILRWARSFMGLELDYVAKKTGIEPEKVNQWESGHTLPTVSQLRRLAKVYRFSIAVFYLPEPPNLNIPRPRDRRFLPGFEQRVIPPELNFEFRWAGERREIALELLANTRANPKPFDAKASLQSTPEVVGTALREILGISYEEQITWRDSRVAFNVWRNRLERLDILVFQASDVSLQAMRGYSMFFDVLPIIGVNRKDTYNARSFTLLHEMAHLLLRMESLCDLEQENGNIPLLDKRIEVFCNTVAGCSLVAEQDLRNERSIAFAAELSEDGERAIENLARKYSVSREAIVRRMLTLGLVDEAFYKTKREQYNREYASTKRSSGGFAHPAVEAFSTSGTGFVGLVVENLNQGFITTSDFSNFLRLKIKHLERLQDSFLLA